MFVKISPHLAADIVQITTTTVTTEVIGTAWTDGTAAPLRDQCHRPPHACASEQ